MAPVESPADRRSMLSTNDFAATATYTPAAAAAVSISGLFVQPFAEAYENPGAATAEPALVVAADDLPGAAAVGDTVTVGGTLYKVRVIAPDGTGMVRLVLEEV